MHIVQHLIFLTKEQGILLLLSVPDPDLEIRGAGLGGWSSRPLEGRGGSPKTIARCSPCWPLNNDFSQLLNNPEISI